MEYGSTGSAGMGGVYLVFIESVLASTVDSLLCRM